MGRQQREGKVGAGGKGAKDVQGSASDTKTGDTIAVKAKGRAGANDGLGGSGIGVVDLLRMLAGGLLLSCALSWVVTGDNILWGLRPWFTRVGDIKTWFGGPLRLTEEELLQYDGTDDKKPIYVGLNGTIYDVSVNRRTYGPGGSYHFFAGRDAARAFITGCFKEDLTGDLRGVEEIFVPRSLDVGAETDSNKEVSKAELKIKREQARRLGKKKVKEQIDDWHKMYRGEKENKGYFKVGEIIREPDWLDKLPMRKLCEAAENTRPMKPEGEQ